MNKKHLFIKSICSLTLAATLLFSNGLATFAQPSDGQVFTYPFEGRYQNYGITACELTLKHEIYFTPDDTLKLLCTGEEAMHSYLGDVSFVVAFLPYATFDDIAATTSMSPADIMNVEFLATFSKGSDAVYFQQTPYSYGQAYRFITPELVNHIRKCENEGKGGAPEEGTGILIAGFMGTNRTHDTQEGGWLQNDFVLRWYDEVTSDYFIVGDTSANAQPAEIENIPSAADSQTTTENTTPEVPVQANGTDSIYTVVKYDTLGVIALNYYGSYEASRQLYEVNKDTLRQNGNKLNEGMQLKLPAVLGNYTIIAPPQISGNEKLYSVKAGDTLRSIAQNVYGDSSLYKNIFERNKDRIKDVNHIYEGLIIVCP